MADKIERDELVKMLAALPNSDSCMATYGPPANYQNITVFRGGDGAWVPLGMKQPQADNRRIRTVQTHKTSANRMPTKEKNMIKLPEPTFDGSKVSEAIAKRRSIRQYDGHALDEQTIANLCFFRPASQIRNADSAPILRLATAIRSICILRQTSTVQSIFRQNMRWM